MHTNVLGRTGLDVSIVGLGTAFLGIPTQDQAAVEYTADNAGGADKRTQMEEELGVQTVHAAVEAGCTLIDTAILYGGTQSERIVGKALRARPDLAERCLVTTKVGYVAGGMDFSADAARRSVYESLERLGLQRLEIVYIHDPMDVAMEQVMGRSGTLAGLRALQAEGIVRFVGSAANDPETNAAYIETGEFDAAVVPEAWSLLNQKALERILPAAERHNVGIVAATTLERGLLATGPRPDVNYLARNFSKECLDHVRKLQALCREHGIPVLAAALQWCVRHPQVATSVPGARTPEEARENARAAEVEIGDGFWQELAPLVRHWEAGVHR